MREGDLRNGATCCLLTCPAATLRSAAATHHAKGGGPVHRAKGANTPCRDRHWFVSHTEIKGILLHPVNHLE